MATVLGARSERDPRVPLRLLQEVTDVLCQDRRDIRVVELRQCFHLVHSQKSALELDKLCQTR